MSSADQVSTWKCPKCGVVNPASKGECQGGFCDQKKPQPKDKPNG